VTAASSPSARRRATSSRATPTAVATSSSTTWPAGRLSGSASTARATRPTAKATDPGSGADRAGDRISAVTGASSPSIRVGMQSSAHPVRR
jgi:hypothetical protein